MAIVKASLRSLWWKELIGTAFQMFDTDKIGMGDVTLNSVPTLTPTYGRQPDGTFAVLIEISAAPSDFDAFELMFLEDTEVEHRLLQMLRDQRPMYVQRLTYNCPPVNLRALWKSLEHFKLVPDSGTLGAGPNRDGSDAAVESRAAIKVTESVRLYRVSLSGLTTTETEEIQCLAGLPFNSDCLSGYPGADQIMVFGAGGAVAAAANALYSMNAGGTIAEFASDPDPFTEIARDIVSAEIGVISETNFRVIFFAGTVAAVKAQWAYGDFPYAAATQTGSWTQVTIAASATTDAVEATMWDQEIGRLYVGVAGDIYVSEDNGESDPGAAKYTGANALAQFAKDEDGNIWAVAASNAILRELANNRNSFAVRTGPSGGGAFTAIAFAKDGVLLAGNGTKIYKNTDKAGSAAAWTELNDFGASHAVINIQVMGGASQTIRAFIDDATPGAGSVYDSEDGGTTWRLVTETANQGYNDVYVNPVNPNRAVIAGDIVSALGVIELLANP